MKYFTYELIAAANEWVEQTEEKRAVAETNFRKAVENYNRELETLKSRVSLSAWKLFRKGFARYGLHDARLLSFNFGDGLNYTADGKKPFLINRQTTSAHIAFLNFEQDFHYLFDLQGISRIYSDIFTEEDLSVKSIGDLYACELTAADNDDLQLGYLFASGTTFIIQFRKLIFRRHRIKREYELEQIYK